MKNVAVYVNQRVSGVNAMVDELISELTRHNIAIMRVTTSGPTVVTPHVYISFVTDLNKFRGRKFDAIFGALSYDVKCFVMPCLKDPGKGLIPDTGISKLLNYIMYEEGSSDDMR